MAEGDNKIARSLMDLQPTAVVELFLIYPDALNHPTVKIPIHAGSIYKNSITWQGKEFIPVAIEVEGFEQNATSQLARPKIRMANKDFLITSLLQNYSDFANARIVRKRTFVKYLDDANFDGDNPFGEADSSAEISNDDYVIGQKTQETKLFVEFELASPLDLENFEINNRRVLGKYCYWRYRGQGCGYEGIPIQREDGKRFVDSGGNYVIPNVDNFSNSDPDFLWEPTNSYSKGDVSYIENSRVIIHPVNKDGTPQAMRTWYVAVADNSGQNPDTNPSSWQKDGCNKKLSACRLRFSPDGELAFEESSVSVEESTIQYTGLYLDGYQNTGEFSTTGPSLTGVWDGAFTIAMWVEPYTSPDGAGYLASTGSIISKPNVFGINSNGEDMNVIYPVGTDVYTGYAGSSNNGRYSLLLFNVDTGTKEIRIERDGELVYRNVLDSTESFGPVSSNAFTVARADGRTPNVIFGTLAVWDRSLKDFEKEFLVELDSEGGRHSRPFARMTGLATGVTGNGLIAWCENITESAGNLTWVDSTVNSNDLIEIPAAGYTGSPKNYSRPITRIAFPHESAAWLPFGGFPGTDGFSFQG